MIHRSWRVESAVQQHRAWIELLIGIVAGLASQGVYELVRSLLSLVSFSRWA